jgi:hypothetical protein
MNLEKSGQAIQPTTAVSAYSKWEKLWETSVMSAGFWAKIHKHLLNTSPGVTATLTGSVTMILLSDNSIQKLSVLQNSSELGSLTNPFFIGWSWCKYTFTSLQRYTTTQPVFTKTVIMLELLVWTSNIRFNQNWSNSSTTERHRCTDTCLIHEQCAWRWRNYQAGKAHMFQISWVCKCIILKPILLPTNIILITTNYEGNVHNTHALITGYTFMKNNFPTISHSQIYVHIHTTLQCISYSLEQLQSS